MNTSQGGSYPKAGERRKRTLFTPAQVELLKKSFEENPYPGFVAREALARSLGIEEDRVHVWFQNRRARTPKRIGSKIRIGIPAAAPCSRSEGTSQRSSLDSSQHIHIQQYYQPQNFDYSETYRGGGFWQAPQNNPRIGEDLYPPQQHSSQELNPVPHQQAAIGGTGYCETSEASNCPVHYYGAEVVRQPPPESAGNFSTSSSSYTPWSAVGSNPGANPIQMLDFDGSVSGSHFFPSSHVRQPLPESAANFSPASSTYTPWSAMGRYPE